MKDLTDEEVIEVVDKITYKPNYRIKAKRSFMSDGLEFIVQMSVPDVDNPNVSTRVGLDRIRPQPFASDKEVIGYVEWLIKDLEHHEFQEWFKYNGERQHETHKFENRIPTRKA